MKSDCKNAAIDSLTIESKAVFSISDYMDWGEFERAVDALSSCTRIMTCASGSSGIAAKKFAHSLCCIERGAMFMPPCEAVHGGLGALKKGDVLIMVSRGGKTAELLPIINACAKREATLIAVTENLESPLANAADIILKLQIERESDPCNIMATSSYIATIGLFDALLAAIMTETNYKVEQFALIHPGGAVGDKLNK